MYILLSACQHPGVLRILYFVTLIMDIIFIIVPIGLIIMLLIDFGKGVIASDEKGFKETKIVVKRIIYAALIFCIPWFVDTFSIFMKNAGFTVPYQECMNNARSGDFTVYDELLAEEERIKEEKKKADKEKKNNSSNNTSGEMKLVASTLISNAKRELGRNNDDLKFSKNYGGYPGLPWCAYFVHWALDNTKVDSNTTIWNYILSGKTVGGCGGSCAGDLIAIFNKNDNLAFNKSSYYGGNYTPKQGDIIFFWWKENNSDGPYWDGTYENAIHSSHIGIVDYVSGNTIYTVEGNTSGGIVNIRERVLNSSEVMGYGSWYGN